MLDLSATRLNGPGLRALTQELHSRGIRVLGVTGIAPDQLGEQAAQLPPLLPSPGDAPTAPALPAPAPTTQPAPGLIHDGPLRSGQRIDHPGDVTILGPVSSGAEINAGGSVHIHGTLRGRVLAGRHTQNAVIYCHRLEAELLAIGPATLLPDNPTHLGHAVLADAPEGRVRVRVVG